MNTTGAEATSITFPAHVTNAQGEQECCAEKGDLFAFLARSNCFVNVAEIEAFLQDYCSDSGAIPQVRSPKKRKSRRDVGPDFYSAYA
jgi:hypothetical protein